MNRRGILGRAPLLIDLTALLDVVFIVLLVVICRQQSITSSVDEAAAQAVTQAEATQAEADAAKALYEDRLETVEEIGTYVDLLTLYVDYTPGNPKERSIRLMNTEGEIETVTMTPASQSELSEKLKEMLQSRMQLADGRPVVFSVDLEHILYRDESTVQAILGDLQREYDNLYLK